MSYYKPFKQKHTMKTAKVLYVIFNLILTLGLISYTVKGALVSNTQGWLNAFYFLGIYFLSYGCGYIYSHIENE